MSAYDDFWTKAKTEGFKIVITTANDGTTDISVYNRHDALCFNENFLPTDATDYVDTVNAFLTDLFTQSATSLLTGIKQAQTDLFTAAVTAAAGVGVTDEEMIDIVGQI